MKEISVFIPKQCISLFTENPDFSPSSCTKYSKTSKKINIETPNFVFHFVL